MAELIIQPWDKEYWSKGARKRLYDEYQTNAMNRRLAEAEGMEGLNRQSTEMTDVRRHGFDLEKMAKNYTNRLGEMDVSYGYDSALAEKQIQARANENALARAAARSDFDYQADKKKRDIMGVLTDRYKGAYRVDNPNMATGDLEMQAALDAEKAYNALQDVNLRGDAAIDIYKIKDPGAFAPGLGARINEAIKSREQDRTDAVLGAVGLLPQQPQGAPAPGSRFPSSSVPVTPGLQGGPRRIKLPPELLKEQSEVDKLRARYQLGN